MMKNAFNPTRWHFVLLRAWLLLLQLSRPCLILLGWSMTTKTTTMAFTNVPSSVSPNTFLATTTGFMTWRNIMMGGDPNNSNEYETPEERQIRMELVKKIQASFYGPSATEPQNLKGKDDNTDEGSTASEKGSSSQQQQQSLWNTPHPTDPTLLCNVPLWRVQWTELPGYQNVLNVHVAHYTHMFRKLLLEQENQQRSTWYFGHVLLPGGSENLGNPDFFLPTKTTTENVDDIKVPSQAPVTGTLMQVSDYRELDDGRLALIVQGVCPMEILPSDHHQQVPYAVASQIRLLPDQECHEHYYNALFGDKYGNNKVGGKGVDGDDAQHRDAKLSLALRFATQAVAVQELELLRKLEFLQTAWDDMDVQGIGVSPLSNVNGTVRIDFDCMEEQLEQVFSTCLVARAQESADDEILIAAASMKLPKMTTTTNLAVSQEEILSLERQVWICLDRMLRLLEVANPKIRIPVPSQLLGLLPCIGNWPPGFRLEGYAEKLEASQSKIGTMTKSEFVRLSKVYPTYPTLRRASRLSYAVWILLGGIAWSRDGPLVSRQDLLQMTSIRERLETTQRHMEGINAAIEQIIRQSSSGGGDSDS